MKRLRQGIRSTLPKVRSHTPTPHVPVPIIEAVPIIAPPIIPDPAYPGPTYGAWLGLNSITDDGDESIVNIFCFGAFANKNSIIFCHDLTGSFPFMSFDGSVCFFVLYHYESNAILGKPIAGLDDVSIFNAYKKYFKDLTAKGFNQRETSWIIRQQNTSRNFSSKMTAGYEWSSHITIK
jgi:hypothetical protein